MSRAEKNKIYIDAVEENMANEVSVNVKCDEIEAMGYTHQQALEILAYHFELYVLTLTEEDRPAWSEFVKDIDILPYNTSDYSFDRVDASKNIRDIKKKYGSIKYGDTLIDKEPVSIVEIFLFLFHHEMNLSSNEALKIIHILINEIIDYVNEESSNYYDYASMDLLYLKNRMIEFCSPNYDIEKIVEDGVVKDRLLQLASIVNDIQYWDKQYGKDGYFRCLSKVYDIDDILNNLNKQYSESK